MSAPPRRWLLQSDAAHAEAAVGGCGGGGGVGGDVGGSGGGVGGGDGVVVDGGGGVGGGVGGGGGGGDGERRSGGRTAAAARGVEARRPEAALWGAEREPQSHSSANVQARTAEAAEAGLSLVGLLLLLSRAREECPEQHRRLRKNPFRLC